MFNDVFESILNTPPSTLSSGLSPVDAIPFDYDSNTYWWDFTSTDNTVEATGDDTYAIVPEQIRGVANLIQPTKGFQPLKQTDGANFNKDSGRQLAVEDVTGITNGKSGWYIALNCVVDTNDSNIMTIARNANSKASRGQIYVPSNREFGLKGDDNDGGSPNWIARAPAISTGSSTWYTLEMELTADGVDTTPVRIWYDGVLQTNTYENGTDFDAFPSTDPSEIVVGNFAETDSDSFDGKIQHMIFYNGVPSSDLRTAFSDYLVGVKP